MEKESIVFVSSVIPGIVWQCISVHNIVHCHLFLPSYFPTHSLGSCLRLHGKFIEVLMDAVLLILATVSFVMSLYVLELPVPVTLSLRQTNSNYPIVLEQYYTLSTCFKTYSAQVNSCSVFICVVIANESYKLQIVWWCPHDSHRYQHHCV